jgi:nucleoside-diphosphate-sugar epimerase
MNILITGATGFVGGVLTRTLLQKGHDVYIVARNQVKADKLLKTIPSAQQKQLHILEGDVTLPHLGIQQEVIPTLIGKIDAVYHIAALVKFNEELRDELFAVNYNGTKHALQLACELHVPSFFHVSTAYTLGKQEIGGEALYDIEGPFNNPYEESKCKAEHLVFSYQDKMNVSIFRPSIIVGDSRTGHSDSTVALYGFIRGLHVFQKRIKRKKVPPHTAYRIPAAAEGTSNLVPVDYVCRVLTAALTHARPNHIYSITNTHAPSNQKILTLICEHLKFPTRIIPVTKPDKLSADEQLLHELVATYGMYLQRHIHFTDENTQTLLAETKTDGLHMDNAMLKRIICGYPLSSQAKAKNQSALV